MIGEPRFYYRHSSDAEWRLAANQSDLSAHINNKNNPHSVTEVATARKLKTARTINGVAFDGTVNITITDDTKIPLTAKGTAGGVAELDTNGKVPSSQLPSYVDDVIEGTLATFPQQGESGKIYVDTDSGLTYRWSGSDYVEISPSLALGETASTAYAGNKGKQNADNIAAHESRIAALESGKADSADLTAHTGDTNNPHGVTKAQLELGNVNNTSDLDKPISTATQAALDAINQKGNSLKYYGDSDIVPSSQDLFTFTTDSEAHLAALSGVAQGVSLTGEIVIPYEYKDGSNVYKVTAIGSQAFSGCTGITKVIMPNTITAIAEEAFKGCTGITQIILPDSILSISWGAFYNCSSLAGITIPKNITTIGVSTFYGCSSLTAIAIPYGVTNIGRWAFGGCALIPSITIPETVTDIYSSVFNGLNSLTDIYYTGTETEWNAINISSGNEPLLNAEIHYNCTPATVEKAKKITSDHNSDSNAHADIRQAILTAVSGVYKPAGSKTAAQINALQNPVVNGIYNILDSGTITGGIGGASFTVEAGDNVAYTADGWDKFAATVDLSGYVTSEQAAEDMSDHNSDGEAHADIRQEIEEAEAEIKARAGYWALKERVSGLLRK